MFALDLFNNDHERRLAEGAVDRLEQRRIDDLAMKMDDLVARAKSATDPEHKAALVREFQKCKQERDSYYKVKEQYGAGNTGQFSSLEEVGIGQDIVNKTEKMARATPPTKAGAVASTVKNAAKWLAGKGGPGKEGPTYEGAEDIADRGEYDQEGDMAKDNIHTIVRNAKELESILGDNDNLPEWVQDKLANIKGMMTAVSDYMQTQKEREHEEATGEEGVTMAEWKKESDWKEIPKSKSGKPVDPRGEVTHLSDVARRETLRKLAQKKNSKEIDEHGGGGAGPRQWHAYVRAHRADESTNSKFDALIKNIQARVSKDAVERPEIMKRVAQMVQQADLEVQDALATAHQLVQQYGQGVEPKPTNVNDIKAQARSGNVMAKLPKTSAGSPTYAQQHATFEGWSDAIVAQRTGQPRTPYSVYIKGRKWKDFENEDHAENVANKLRAKFKADGRDPSVITIAPTDYDKGMDEAANPAQQAAIAVAMKKAHKKPKHVDEAEDQIDPIILKALERLQPGLEGSQLYSAAKEALALEFGLMKVRGDSTFVHYLNQLRDLYSQRSIAEAQLGEEKTRLDPKCWKGKKIGNPKTKMKGGVRVNNCVPAESVETFESKVQDQGITDAKLLEAARKIDQLAKSFK